MSAQPRGLYLRFGDEITLDANARVHALAERLLEDPLEGITEIIPGINTLYFEYDIAALPRQALLAWILGHAQQARNANLRGRLVEIPVNYDGCDLAEVARQSGLRVAEVVQRHAQETYSVLLIGFSPGQPYMGMVHPSIRVPRRSTPRPRAPTASVVLANALTTIGPFAQPTGWLLLGRALRMIYDPHEEPPALLKPGDRVRFRPATGTQPSEPSPRQLLPRRPARPLFQVLQAGLLDLVVDSGREMAERFGLPRSGPIDPRSARQANQLVGNPWNAPVIEVNLSGPRLKATGSGVAVLTGWGVRPQLNGQGVDSFRTFAFRAGDVLSFLPIPHGVRGYLAVAGSLESERYLGSASVSQRGRIGRPLAPGDLLGAAHDKSARPGYGFKPFRELPDSSVTLRIVPGPQASRLPLEQLMSGSFKVTASDRIGVRLAGPLVSGGEVVSEAVPVGAVQVPAGGAPILLLNDRGTTGGYAKPAIVHPADLPIAGQLRLGTEVRFVLHRETLFETIDMR